MTYGNSHQTYYLFFLGALLTGPRVVVTVMGHSSLCAEVCLGRPRARHHGCSACQPFWPTVQARYVCCGAERVVHDYVPTGG